MSTTSFDDPTTMLPVLIVPGIMSSGLEVRKSGVGPRHVGERVWINPVALGFGALYMGRALEIQEEGGGAGPSKKKKKGKKEPKKKESKSKSDDDEFESDTDDDSDEEEAEEETAPGKLSETKHRQEHKCKSAWLQHLSLKGDMCTEREGNEIRPIPGLAGVDFLTDLATVKVGASYVFGPVIKMLEKAGYERGVNLDAVPYDWRVPPSALEERDGYFTASCDRIERMYRESDDTPVVLLCHSMGCKTGHYLLNFAKQHRGQQWIDKYVHTYMPCGAPHIGAPMTIGQVYSASLNPLLDPMLSDEERLIFGRSLGSAPWLMPGKLPSNVAALPTILYRREGLLEISVVGPIGDCDTLVRNKHGTRAVEPFRLKVKYGRRKGRSSVAKPVEADGDEDDEKAAPARYFSVSDSTFFFPTSPAALEDGTLEPLQFMLMEPGTLRAHEKEPTSKVVTSLRLIDRNYQVRKLADSIAKNHSFKSNLAMSTPQKIDAETLSKAEGHEMELTVPIVARVDMSLRKCEPKKDHRSIQIKVRLRWIPPLEAAGAGGGEGGRTRIAELADAAGASQLARADGAIEVAGPGEAQPPPFAPIPEIKSEGEGDDSAKAEYIPLDGETIIREEGLGDSLVRLVSERYESDPVGPRTLSSSDAPPVGRVYAVYGVNLNTWVSAVCKRAPALVQKKGKVKPMLVMDEQASIAADGCDEDGCDENGYALVDGVISETARTPQKDLRTGETVRRSGDGTVPYWSLQRCQAWDDGDRCRVRIEEIDGAEHRAMLNDPRFHRVLLDYVGGRANVDLYEAEAAKTLQRAAGGKFLKKKE